MVSSNFSIDSDALLTEVNDEKVRVLTPVLVYITILMISGVIGNSMVCYYYGFQARLTTNTFFIIVLAVYDLLACAIAMPTEIADTVLYYKFESGAACKILSLVNFFTAMGSAFTLIAIALDRFNRIKRIRGRQMEIKHAKWISLILALVSLTLTWPALLLYDAVTVEIDNKYGIYLLGRDCTSVQEESAEPYLWAFNILHFAVFFICSGALIVFYAVIGKTIYKHRRRMIRYSLEAENISTSCQETYIQDGDVTENGKKINIKKDDGEMRTQNEKSANIVDQTNEPSTNVTELSTGSENDESRVERRTKTGKHFSLRNDTEAVRITFLMIAVTALFILSFLPALCLIAWRTAAGESDSLSNASLVAYKIGARSYMLNSSLNPWIYGIFNSEFRKYFSNKVFKCCSSVKSKF